MDIMCKYVDYKIMTLRVLTNDNYWCTMLLIKEKHMAEILEPEIPSFIRRKGELDKLLKKVDKLSIEALEYLDTVMKDEKADPKLRVQCAREIIAVNIETAKISNNDKLQRLAFEIKLNPEASQRLSGSGQKQMPIVDFNNVLKIA